MAHVAVLRRGKMKNKLSLLLASLFLFLSFSLTANAEGTDRVCDMAGLLSASEKEELEEVLGKISEEYKLDLVAVTANDTEGKTSEEYADDFFDYGGYGYGDDYDGVLLLINMELRELYIGTSGRGIEIVTDYGIKHLLDCIYPYAADGDYATVIREFANVCEDLAYEAENGDPYDTYYPNGYGGENDDIYVSYDESYKEPFPVFKYLIFAVIIGFIAAFIVTGVMKGQLKSVKKQYFASGYVTGGGLELTEHRDTFLYSNVIRTAIPQNTSSGGSSMRTASGGGHFGGSTTHTSSSGRIHGGGGRRF